jgi:hypothetical protein
MTMTQQKRLPLILFSLLVAGLACRVFAPAASMPTAVPPVGVDSLIFSDSQTGEHFRALAACLQAVTAEGWRATGYQLIGNFHRAGWCRGAGARDDCQIAAGVSNNRDQHVLYLETYFYPSKYPEVFGLGTGSLLVPTEDGWGAAFSFSEGGGGLSGEGVSLGFVRHEAGAREPVAAISIIGPFSYKSFQTDLVELGIYAPEILELSNREKLSLALSSPEAMRNMGLQYQQSLAVEVEASLRSADFLACDRAEYKGDGIQPACTPRPLTDGERSGELTRAANYFSNQEAWLREHYLEMYAVLFESFPFERCW